MRGLFLLDSIGRGERNSARVRETEKSERERERENERENERDSVA